MRWSDELAAELIPSEDVPLAQGAQTPWHRRCFSWLVILEAWWVGAQAAVSFVVIWSLAGALLGLALLLLGHVLFWRQVWRERGRRRFRRPPWRSLIARRKS